MVVLEISQQHLFVCLFVFTILMLLGIADTNFKNIDKEKTFLGC